MTGLYVSGLNLHDSMDSGNRNILDLLQDSLTLVFEDNTHEPPQEEWH